VGIVFPIRIGLTMRIGLGELGRWTRARGVAALIWGAFVKWAVVWVPLAVWRVAVVRGAGDGRCGEGASG
jgi:hypothetical protein